MSIESHNAPPPDSGDVPPHHLHHHVEHAAHGKLHGEWMDSFRHQKDAEFKTEADGSYAVHKGDTLETIARRALKHEHKDDPHYHASSKEVLEEEKRIRDANKGHDLDHHLKVGDRLKVPGIEKPAEVAPPQAQQPTPPSDVRPPGDPPPPPAPPAAEVVPAPVPQLEVTPASLQTPPKEGDQPLQQP